MATQIQPSRKPWQLEALSRGINLSGVAVSYFLVDELLLFFHETSQASQRGRPSAELKLAGSHRQQWRPDFPDTQIPLDPSDTYVLAMLRVFSPRHHQTETKPSHWVDAQGSAFQNPWPSWRLLNWKDALFLINARRSFPSVSAETSRLISTQKPTWGLEETKNANNQDAIKATWLGHACFFVEFPIRSHPGTRGIRILFDPVWSDRCSPTQWMGPKRYTAPPCQLEDIPEVDAIVISHNHYDHLDTHTIEHMSRRPRVPHFFAPLGNGPYFKSLGIPDSHIHILDWWDSRRLELFDSSGKDNSLHAVDITCTPAQHFTGRGIFDMFKSLWATWVVEEIPEMNNNSYERRPPAKIFFGGDTGYRAVMDHQNEDEVPVCPAFKEIGQRFGGFDFAMIPIGAYLPREYMSPIHCAPQDSVRLYKDIKAKKALGMHWGTWVLTGEEVLDPPRRLAEQCKKLDIKDEDFGVCDIGETHFF